MKKMLILALFLLGFFGVVTNASAMTEQELEKKMTQSYVINGSEFTISADNKVLLERYLNTYDVSEQDADYIATKVDEAVAIIKASGATNVDNLSVTAKNQLKSLVTDVSTNTAVKATVNNGSVVIYNPDGSSVFAEVNKLVKQTGTVNGNMNLAVTVSFGILLVGSLVVIKKYNLLKNV